ncbi:MAG: cytochrome d ubiquinol oxidase subunit II, partial [Burkholderiaceae bacterium]|nr:cytochrome d ubiquinol oxidase subunit II [Burkholderiaceae bacterium]
LILRGVSFDFRVKARDEHKHLWNRTFAIGSLITSMAQGWMLGSYLTGFSYSGWSLAFSAGIMLVFPTAYVMLGAGWLMMKTWGDLQLRAVGWARAMLWPMGLTLVAISLATPLVSQTVFDKWFTLPEFFALLPIPLACGAAFCAAYMALNRPRIVEAGYGWIVFASTVLIFLMAFLGLAYSIYPYVVLDKLTIWDAASSTEALAVIMIGVAITLPVIIIYTIFMYRVFWGKATTLTYAAPPKA